MLAFWAIVRRELSSYFASLTGYVLISAVLFLMGLSFTDLLERLAEEATDVPITELFYQTWYFWLILLLASPLITMRTFAQEKAAGTFETLTTTPVGDLQIVLSKFTGALLFHLMLWLPLLLCILVVRYYTNDTTAFGFRLLLNTYLGIALVGALYMAMGCFASSLTRSQIIAAMLTLVLGFALFLLSFRSLLELPQTSWTASVISQVSMIEHLQDFVRGVLDTRQVVFFLSLSVFFLYLTLKSVESRRWK